MHDLLLVAPTMSQDSVPTKDARLGLAGISTGMYGFPSCMVAGWGVQTIALATSLFSTSLVSGSNRQNTTVSGAKYHKCLMTLSMADWASWYGMLLAAWRFCKEILKSP